MKSTPEGARDYLVPSRIYQGKLDASAGTATVVQTDPYGWRARSLFPDRQMFQGRKDLRADRQPEFTQLDMEMSFVQPEHVIGVVEGMIALLFRELKGIDVTRRFQRLTWEEAMARFGSDKPDMRFSLELRELHGALRQSQFRVFAAAIEKGGVVKCIRIPNGGEAVAQRFG